MPSFQIHLCTPFKVCEDEDLYIFSRYRQPSATHESSPVQFCVLYIKCKKRTRMRDWPHFVTPKLLERILLNLVFGYLHYKESKKLNFDSYRSDIVPTLYHVRTKF
jgi:hypothetical protein